MDKKTTKTLRKVVIAVPLLALAIYFIPILTILFVLCGLVDVLRNDIKDRRLFERYFLGNGMLTWLLSPFNLLVDLLSYRNWKIYRLENFPAGWQAEIDG